MVDLKYGSTRIFSQTNIKVWNRDYFLKGTLNMEPHPRKLKNIPNVKQI